MSLKIQIEEDMRAAMKAKNDVTLATLRLLLSAIKQWEIDQRHDIDEGTVIGVIEKMIKQRKESFKIYEEASRTDLAEKEKAELDVLTTYLPTQLTDVEVEEIMMRAISEMSASGMKDMGKVMGVLRTELSGKADLSKVSSQVRQLLSKD